jgi:hypothetical protein
MTHAHGGTYTLTSGRTVFLSRLLLGSTYAGQLEGTLETASYYIRRSLAERIAEVMQPGKPLVVVGNDTSVLPSFQWIAEFHSQRAVHTDDPDYSSQLFVCWFTDDIPDTLHSAIADVLAAVNWEAQATDYDIMP